MPRQNVRGSCRGEGMLMLVANVQYSIVVVCPMFVCISLTADGPQRPRLPIPPTVTLPSCQWSRRIFPSLPGSRLMSFYRDAGSALLQLVNCSMVEFHLLALSRFPLLLLVRKALARIKPWSNKNRIHDFRDIIVGIRGYLRDHSGRRGCWKV